MAETDHLAALERRRTAGEKIVFTNGCFDLLHAGHVRYLREARDLGDLLVVGINSDASVRRLKGPNRPIIDQGHRKELLEELKSVDFVFIFEEDTPLNLILRVKPQVLAKGGDWQVDQIVGGREVTAWGGNVRSLSLYEGLSTTSIVDKIIATSPS